MAKRSQVPTPATPPPPEVTIQDYVKGEFDRVAAKDYVPRAESDHAYLRVGLDRFEGPLDLLLHLIRKHALDIMNIPVSFITEQFLAVLEEMKAADIDIAARQDAAGIHASHAEINKLIAQEKSRGIAEENIFIAIHRFF